MMGSALAINELAQAEVILRRWMRLNPSNIVPRYTLMTLLAQGVGQQIEEALRIGAESVAAAQFPTERVTSRSALAELHLRTGDLASAAQVLKDARYVVDHDLRNFGTAGSRAYYTPFANFTYHLADCRLALARLQLDPAEAACRQALSWIDAAWNYRRMVPPLVAVAAATRMAEARLTMAEVQLARNRPFEAETLVVDTLREAAANNANPYLSFQAADLRWRIRMAQGDFSQLRRMQAEALKSGTEAGLSAASLGFITFRRNLQTGLVLMRDWPAAQAEFERGDRLLAQADPLLRQSALNLVPRALTLVATGRLDAARGVLDTALATTRADFGDTHARTAIVRGLAALAAEPPDPSALASSAALLLDPAAPGADLLDRGELALARQMILQTFIDTTGDAASPAQASLAFRAADALRGSVVQQAVNDAAVRAAALTQGLGEIVRRDQDARHELQALYTFIANEASALESQRRDAVVAQMKQRIAELERQRIEVRAEIARRFPDYERLVRPRPASVDDVRARLRDGETFVALAPTSRSVHVWAITSTGVRHHRAAVGPAALDALVARLRKTLDVADLGDRMPAFDTQAAHGLYLQLLQPVLGDSRPKHLIVAAGGSLGQIPFAVLLREPSARADAQAAWLIRDTAISHTAGANAWLATRQLPAPGGALSLAAWADPLFDRAASQGTRGAARALSITRSSTGPTPGAAVRYASVPPLPETRDEVAAIARSLGADASRDALYGERATRESVLQASSSGALAGRRVLVFATHGLVAGDLPNLTQPALAMAATGREAQEPLAPLLTLQDVLGLKLNADWVVLSACNTAAADGQAEEALSGLARGFFYAGARSLLVTHWSVESESAMALTTATFAHQAANPGAAKAESLRQAILSVMARASYTHPAYWAPYALVGEGG